MGIGDAIKKPRKAPASSKMDPEQILDGLNPEQREVAQHFKGPLLVAAVAGAGKTHALVRRILYLIKVHEVDPRRILAVTFSRKGADEMAERLDALVPDHGARVGTFHSLALQILRAEVEAYQDWTVDDRGRYRFCIKDAVGFREMDWKDADVTLLEGFISFAKCNLARPDSDIAAEIAADFAGRQKKYVSPARMLQAYQRAEELRIDRQLLTFDDMLMEAVELLRDDDGVRQRWASRWDFVMQDEAQDQNLGQLLMGELLSQDHRNYMLIGDPAQTIYTWRGAKPEKLLGFEDAWTAKVVRMHRNYRCCNEVVTTANAALTGMDPSTKLDMTITGERGNSGVLTSTQFLDLDDEGEGIAARIQQSLEDGKEPRDFVILYRTNAQSRAPEEALIGARIPYRIIGGACFYERREVKNLLAYLRLASGRGTLEDIGRCINTPFRFLGKKFVERVEEAAKDARPHRTGKGWGDLIRTVSEQAGIQRRQRDGAEGWAELVERVAFRIERGKAVSAAGITDPENNQVLKDAMPAKVLEDIVRETRYTEWLRKDEGEESTENSRVSNIREMIRAATRFPTVDELLDYVDKTIKASKDQRKAEKDDPNKVTLCSLHRSKGLEWPVVFLAGCSDGILPHARAEEPEEERRLFYVGVTRARDELHVSCALHIALSNRVMDALPSPFLTEAGIPPRPARGMDEDEPQSAGGDAA